MRNRLLHKIRHLMSAALLAALLPCGALAAPPVQQVAWRDMHAWLVSDDTLPLITVKMAWLGGSASETKAGVSMLMARLMNEGAGDLPAKQFQQAMADKAISIGFNSELDEVTATLRCLKRYQQTCFNLLKMAVTAPRFDAEAVARMKGEQRAAILRAQQSPGTLAARRFRQLAFPDHPYARSVNGTLQQLDALSVDDIRARYRAALARDNLRLAVVGDISRAEVRRMMRDVFGGLPAQNSLTLPRDIVAADGPQTAHIERAGPQTTIVFGHRGIGYDDPLFFPAFVMNSILGGSGFSSRLTEQVREARGLSYGVYSYFSNNQHAALWRGSVASDNKTAQQALDVIRGEMQRMAEGGVSAERLASAKTYLTGAYALRFDSGSKIASQLIGVQLMGLPIDYFTTRNQSINAVTMDDIKRAAQTLLVDNLLVVSVGGTAVTLAPRAQTQ